MRTAEMVDECKTLLFIGRLEHMAVTVWCSVLCCIAVVGVGIHGAAEGSKTPKISPPSLVHEILQTIFKYSNFGASRSLGWLFVLRT